MGTAPTHSPEGVPQRSGIIEKKRVRVQNARLQHQLPRLDRNGFQLRRRATALRDFSDEAMIRELRDHARSSARVLASDGDDDAAPDHTRVAAAP